MTARVRVIQLKDRFDTEVRELTYRGAEIRIDCWKTLGYRLKRKSAEVRFPDGVVKSIWTGSSNDRTFSVFKSNEEIFREGKDMVRKWYGNRD